MYPYTQSIGTDGARLPTDDAYHPYYQQPRQQPDRAYQTSTQAQTQPQAQPQQNTSQYYQGQFGPYYYSVPVTNADGTAVSGQDRYQTANLYQTYGQGYNQPSNAAQAASAQAPPATGAAATTPGARPAAAYPYAPYTGDMAMMSMIYPQTQNGPATQAHNVGQSQAGASQGQSPVQMPPTNGVQNSIPQPPNAARGYAPRQYPATLPQSQIMPNGNSGMRRTNSPLINQRATINTHISAIPVGMPITDPTGQTPPPGIKPRVTTTLWEDEGTTCFQVDARGFCVARREDNDMINGTKLLNVAGMTRGRRDGLLKGERNRHVVKAGAMHLKGVWIPYDRALDFANKERIVDLLYPLFVHDIKAVLYHPGNNSSEPRPRPVEGNASSSVHPRQQVPVVNGQPQTQAQGQHSQTMPPSMPAQQPQQMPSTQPMQQQMPQQMPQQMQLQQMQQAQAQAQAAQAHAQAQAQAQAQSQAQPQTQPQSQAQPQPQTHPQSQQPQVQSQTPSQVQSQDQVQQPPLQQAQHLSSVQSQQPQLDQIPQQSQPQQQNQSQAQIKAEVSNNSPQSRSDEPTQSIPSMHLPEITHNGASGYQSQPIQRDSMRQADVPAGNENTHSLGQLDGLSNQYEPKQEESKKSPEAHAQHTPTQHTVQNENYNYESGHQTSATESNSVFYN